MNIADSKTLEYIAYSGKEFTLEWYYNKKSEALEYYQSLTVPERRAVLNLTKFRSEGNKIYAFKTNQERFLCFSL